MTESPNPTGQLNALLAEAGQSPLEPISPNNSPAYLSIFAGTSASTSLQFAMKKASSPATFSSPSLAPAPCPSLASLLDFGSGAGFPGLPIALCRPEIAVTLAESQGKKSAYLREAVRVLGVTVMVHSARAEDLRTVFDCVVLRAVDKMESPSNPRPVSSVPAAGSLS